MILLNLYTACKKDIKEVPSTVGLITMAYYVEKGPFAKAKIGPYELFDKSFQSLIEKKFLHACVSDEVSHKIIKQYTHKDMEKESGSTVVLPI